jgi:hypothetical protein
MEDKFTKTILKKLFLNHVNYCNTKMKIYEEIEMKQRLPNFPEDISENIVKYIIEKKLNIKLKWHCKTGDLQYDDKKIEVKCFCSMGPSSFGPNEKWDEIYFLDATNFINKKFVCYRIKLSNNNEYWKKIKINKVQTFEEQCVQKRRPRISFKELYKQIPEKYKEKIYDGFFDDIIS